MSDFAKDTNVPANDCISRQAAIDALISEGRSVDSRYISAERIIHESDAIEAISMLPSAEPKKGKWEAIDVYEVVVACSECKKMFTYEHNYCPNCGAKMEVTE